MICIARTFGAPERVPAGRVARRASTARMIDEHHVLGALLRVGE
jgi:hypothetical protein